MKTSHAGRFLSFGLRVLQERTQLLDRNELALILAIKDVSEGTTSYGRRTLQPNASNEYGLWKLIRHLRNLYT